MCDNKTFLIFMALVLGVPMAAAVLEMQARNNLAIEAVKAGLVQKIDTETKQPIWVKP